MRNVRSLLFALPLLLPIACGGGDGGTAQVTITAQNAEEVASTVLGALQFMDGFEELLGEFVFVIEDAASGTFPCPGGGTMTLSINDVAPLDEISVGDSASITFNGCIVDMDGESVTLSGSLSFNVLAVTSVPAPGYDAMVRFTFSNLALAMGTDTVTVNGGLTAEASTPDDVLFTTDVTGDSLRASIAGPGGTDSAVISAFDDLRTNDDATGAFTIASAGTLYQSDMAGEVDYETTAPFAGTHPNPPGAGVLLVTGGGGTSMLLSAVDDVNARLDVDTDGDGTRETVINTTWAVLVD